MRKRQQQHEEHDNLDRWLLTYADLITLLLGLFVILYAISKVDAQKFQQIATALENVFGGNKPSVISGGNKAQVPSSLPKFDGTRDLNDVKRLLEAEITKSGKANSVLLTSNERGLTVHLLEELMFETGKATLKTASLEVLDSLAAILKYIHNDVRIEGHTDNVPIHNEMFASNWHLAIARALNVAYYLMEKHELAPDKLAIIGYGEYHPIESNDTEEGRAKNRRVDIVIVAKNTTP